MQSRQQRRAAERQAAKEARSAINRENARHSTGPRTAEGKAASSQNSFKHGLYSKALIYPGENPAELDALKADLRAEHQPANTTEEILVNEMAEQFWRIRRWREREARLMDTTDAQEVGVALTQVMPAIQRLMTAAERGFHKSLTALRQLQKDRGFVPHSSKKKEETADAGFVPQKETSPKTEPPRKYTPAMEARWAEAVKYGDVAADDIEVKDLMAADMEYICGESGFVSQNG